MRFMHIPLLLVVAISITIPHGCACDLDSGYSFNGDGSPAYPNVGHVWASASNNAGDGGCEGTGTAPYASSSGDVYYVHASGGSSVFTIDSEETSSGATWAFIAWNYPAGGEYLTCSALGTGCSGIDIGGGVYTFPNPTNSIYVVGTANLNVYSGQNSGGSSHVVIHFDTDPIVTYNVTGSTGCLDGVTLYIDLSGTYRVAGSKSLNESDSYIFGIMEGESYRLLFSNGMYYDFICDGEEVFDYDACYYVYGYTCGIDTIKLRDASSQLIETVYQTSGYDIYEMRISDGEEYTISFYDMGILLCYSQEFTCASSDVLIDYDRCNWVWPPSPWGPPIIIYLWAGYDYNIVVLKDEHGNFVENSQLAIYDKTDDKYIQRWTDTAEGYTLLGARFDTTHDVQLAVQTFDGVFTLDTTYPANGTAEVGDENIVTTNWTIPIKYNLNLYPVDQYGVTLFDVFCGLSEYTPLNPGAFWGMDLSDQGYVPVTNCSGFAMCDIVAEKEGYADYRVEALNWTSKSAMVKDYRHNVVMEEE